MRSISQHLNRINANIKQKSQLAITTVVSAELGSGKVNQLMARQGVTLAEWNFKFISDISGQKNGEVNDVQIVFCIKELPV